MITTPSSALSSKTPQVQPFSMVSGKNDRMAGSVPVWNSVASFAENLADTSAKTGEPNGTDSSFGFSDIIDMVNPLQHIPIVSNLYQSATGDTLGSIAKIVGGALFGGPVGALVSAGMVAYQSAKSEGETAPVTGHDLSALQGTTVALADMRAGYKPYNT